MTLYMFRTVFPSIIRSSKTVHTATGICQTDTAVCLLAHTASWFYYGNNIMMHTQPYERQIQREFTVLNCVYYSSVNVANRRFQ